MPEKESAARPPPHSKNPQDYLKPILAKEPDRVKGIRTGEFRPGKEFAPLKISTVRAARDTWHTLVRTSLSSTR